MSDMFESLGTRLEMLRERDIFARQLDLGSDLEELTFAVAETASLLQDIYTELKDVKAELKSCKRQTYPLYPKGKRKTS